MTLMGGLLAAINFRTEDYVSYDSPSLRFQILRVAKEGGKTNYYAQVVGEGLRDWSFCVFLGEAKDIDLETLFSIAFMIGVASQSKRVLETVWKGSSGDRVNFLSGLSLVGRDLRSGNAEEPIFYSDNDFLLRELKVLFQEMGRTVVLEQQGTGGRLEVRKKVLSQDFDDSPQFTDLGNVVSLGGKGPSVVLGSIPTERGVETYQFSRVVATTVTSYVAPTYTMAVEDDLHQFVADGVIHKNTGAEVTRIGMVRAASAFKKAGYTRKEVSFVMQLHDELSFLVRDDLLKEVLPVIKKALEIHVKSWEVQLQVGFKVGQVWGAQKELSLEELL